MVLLLTLLTPRNRSLPLGWIGNSPIQFAIANRKHVHFQAIRDQREYTMNELIVNVAHA